MNETQAISLFRKMHPEALMIKLHGNRFQANLPDILLLRDGKVSFLEFKVIDAAHLAWSKLRLGQHTMMLQMQKYGADVWYVVWSKKGKIFTWVRPEHVKEGESLDLLASYLDSARPF
jgi:hypothetical protein